LGAEVVSGSCPNTTGPGGGWPTGVHRLAAGRIVARSWLPSLLHADLGPQQQTAPCWVAGFSQRDRVEQSGGFPLRLRDVARVGTGFPFRRNRGRAPSRAVAAPPDRFRGA